MDTLGEILDLLHLTSVLHWRTELYAPWGLHMDPTSDMVFHVVADGTCWLQADGMADPLLLHAGDLVVLPHGPQHLLRSDLAVPPACISHVQFATERGCQVIANMGAGAPATVLCGVFRFAPGDGPPLDDLLPAIIYCPQDANRELLLVLGLLANAAQNSEPGATLIQSRLADLLFVYAMRFWLIQSERTPSWLNALRDPQIGTTLGLMHRQPAHAWTVAEFAHTVGLSRSAFCARFTALVGQPPMRYLLKWRIAAAARDLRRTSLPLATIAVQVGFATVAALSKAFKQEMGVSPRGYRTQHSQEKR